MDDHPYVSVIVPAFNSQKTIAALIQSLLDQSYPCDSFEIIIVDNNSGDDTKRTVGHFPVRLLEEARIQSSYAARNRGIEAAKGQIIAFIDADCLATRHWLQEGVEKLISAGADLVGGKVDFFFADKTPSEMYDAITHFNMEWSIKHQGTTGSGNLFVRREVFKRIGSFRQDVRSGGDMQFTRKAVACGCKLVYCAEARVLHPARAFGELIEKSRRIGAGSIDVLASRGLRRSQILLAVLRDAAPPRPGYIKRLIRERGTPDMHKRFLEIFAVTCIFRMVKGAAAIVEYVR